MFVRNDLSPEKRYFNGKIGKIRAVDAPYIWNNIHSMDAGSGPARQSTAGCFIESPIAAWRAGYRHRCCHYFDPSGITDGSGGWT
jgi:hypothetical protein